jgi:hypothetical protein
MPLRWLSRKLKGNDRRAAVIEANEFDLYLNAKGSGHQSLPSFVAGWSTMISANIDRRVGTNQEEAA